MAWLGFFYGGNTVGAVFGCLFAGFYLLPNFTMARASYVAAGINLSVAIISTLISVISGYSAISELKNGEMDGKEVPDTGFPELDAWHNGSIYVAIAMSGMTALGTEVIWTRLLSLLLGATVYTFSIILAVFLVGLGFGSSVGAMVTRTGMNTGQGRWWCVRFCWRHASAGRRMRSATVQCAGRWTCIWRPARCTCFKSTWRGARGRFCRRRYSGGRVSHWRMARWRAAPRGIRP